MTVDLRSVPVRVVVGGLDLSPGFVSLSVGAGTWDDSGWFKVRGQLELAAYWEGQPESFDCRDNPARWAPGTVVAIAVDLGAGWVPLPWRLRILAYPNRPNPRQPTITLDLGGDADLLNYRAPEGDPGTDEYGTPTGATTLINRALAKAGAPTLTDTVTGLSLPFSPEKNTGGSWMTYAGQVAYAARHILWQQADGAIRAVPFDLDALTTPIATYTVGTNEADYIPEAPGEQPPEVCKVQGTTYEISDATPEDTDVTENINGVITRTQVQYEDWLTSQPKVIETVSIPLELMVIGKFVGITALFPYKKTTNIKTYDDWNRLVEEHTQMEMPGFTVPFSGSNSTGLMTVGETVVTYEFPPFFSNDPDVLAATKTSQVMTRKVTVERALYKINDGTLELQDRIVTTETWEQKGPELYLYRINTRDDAGGLQPTSRNSQPSFQGPPATTFKPAEKQRTEKQFQGQARFQSPAGSGFAEKLWSVQLPSGMGISNDQCRQMAQLWGKVRQGRQFPIKWAADLSSAWLTNFSPLQRVDFTVNGTTTAYLVEALQLVITQRDASVGGKGLELGRIVGGVLSPPYVLVTEIQVALTAGRAGAAVAGNTPASGAISLAAQSAGAAVAGVAGVGASVAVAAQSAGAAVVGNTPEADTVAVALAAGRGGASVAGLAGVSGSVAVGAQRGGAVVAGIEPETTTLLAALTGSYDSARRTAINTLIKSLKDNGIWTKLDVLCIAGLNSTDALINWKSPGTFNGTAVSSPTFTADRGFAGNGSTSYVNTNFNPVAASGNYALNSAHIAVYSRTNLQQSSTDIGGDSGSNFAIIAPRFGAENFYYIGVNSSATDISGASPGSSGFLLATRTSSAQMVYYRNGSSVASSTAGSTAMPNANFFVCRRNNNSFPQYSTRQIAVWSIGGGLNATEVSNFNAAINTYLTYIGANV